MASKGFDDDEKGLFVIEVSDKNFTLSAVETKGLLLAWGIDDILRQKWKGVLKLVEYNALGAVKLLAASGALKGREEELEFDIDVADLSGTGTEAWSQYKECVLVWLRTINNAAALEKAREELRDEIIAVFVEKAPSYPSEVGEMSPEFSHNIQKYGEVENNNYLYMFSTWGIIHMQDTRMSSTRLRSRIWGAPKVTMRCVRFDQQMMKKWEGICSTSEGLSGAKSMADNASHAPIANIGAKLREIKFC